MALILFEQRRVPSLSKPGRHRPGRESRAVDHQRLPAVRLRSPGAEMLGAATGAPVKSGLNPLRSKKGPDSLAT